MDYINDQNQNLVQMNNSVQSMQDVAGVQQSKVVPASSIVSEMQPMQQVQQVQQLNNVTTLAELQSYAQGTVVRLPDFAEGQPLVARLIRPSMLVLAKSGKIPNTLMATAAALFNGDNSKLDSDNENLLKDMYDVCHIICEASLVQPTLQEIESVGLTLSDNQVMAIFNYAQIGAKALESFRE